MCDSLRGKSSTKEEKVVYSTMPWLQLLWVDGDAIYKYGEDGGTLSSLGL